jgi:hypothetical protein
VRPPTIQHFAPVAAPSITVFAGVPHVQSERLPPVVQLPLVVSNPSVYGNTETGVPHCAFTFWLKQNRQVNEKIILMVLYESNPELID